MTINFEREEKKTTSTHWKFHRINGKEKDESPSELVRESSQSTYVAIRSLVIRMSFAFLSNQSENWCELSLFPEDSMDFVQWFEKWCDHHFIPLSSLVQSQRRNTYVYTLQSQHRYNNMCMLWCEAKSKHMYGVLDMSNLPVPDFCT